jgi:4-hydroxybenzoate polyprenyltransferase
MRLFRIPNVFTAMADIMMGFLFVQGGPEPLASLGCLVLATSFLYTAGMILNDVYDVEVDRRERPHRPLPSGTIPVGTASSLGYAMLLLGVGCAGLATWVAPVNGAQVWRPAAVAAALAVCIVLYDAVLKKTPLAPLAMGGCRLLNVLLGMSAGAPVAGLFGFGSHHWVAAAGVGVYIVGVTWFARTEARQSNAIQLALACVVMVFGFALLILFPHVAPVTFRPMLQDFAWPVLIILIGGLIVRRAAMAVLNPQPPLVQAAVRNCILSLIVLDAAVALNVSNQLWALGILCLLAPTLLLGRWVYST